MNLDDEREEWLECETCQGTGKIDQRLGGYCEDGVVDCPDCDGTGEYVPK